MDEWEERIESSEAYFKRMSNQQWLNKAEELRKELDNPSERN